MKKNTRSGLQLLLCLMAAMVLLPQTASAQGAIKEYAPKVHEFTNQWVPPFFGSDSKKDVLLLDKPWLMYDRKAKYMNYDSVEQQKLHAIAERYCRERELRLPYYTNRKAVKFVPATDASVDIGDRMSVYSMQYVWYNPEDHSSEGIMAIAVAVRFDTPPYYRIYELAHNPLVTTFHRIPKRLPIRSNESWIPVFAKKNTEFKHETYLTVLNKIKKQNCSCTVKEKGLFQQATGMKGIDGLPTTLLSREADSSGRLKVEVIEEESNFHPKLKTHNPIAIIYSLTSDIGNLHWKWWVGLIMALAGIGLTIAIMAISRHGKDEPDPFSVLRGLVSAVACLIVGLITGFCAYTNWYAMTGVGRFFFCVGGGLMVLSLAMDVVYLVWGSIKVSPWVLLLLPVSVALMFVGWTVVGGLLALIISRVLEIIFSIILAIIFIPMIIALLLRIGA